MSQAARKALSASAELAYYSVAQRLHHAAAVLRVTFSSQQPEQAVDQRQRQRVAKRFVERGAVADVDEQHRALRACLRMAASPLDVDTSDSEGRREVRGPVDVAQHARIADRDFHHLLRVRGEQRASPLRRPAGRAARRMYSRAMPTGWPRRARKYGVDERRAPGQRVAHRCDRARTDERHVGERDEVAVGGRPRRAPRRRGSRPCLRRRSRTPRPRSLRSRAVRNELSESGAPRPVLWRIPPSSAAPTAPRSARRAAGHAAACRSRSGSPSRRKQHGDDVQVLLDFAGRRIEARARLRRPAWLGHAVAHRGHLGEDRDGDLGRRLAADVQAHRPCRRAISLAETVEFLEPLAARVVVLLRADRADVERRRLQRFHQRQVVELGIVRERDHRAVRRRDCSSRTTSSGMPRVERHAGQVPAVGIFLARIASPSRGSRALRHLREVSRKLPGADQEQAPARPVHRVEHACRRIRARPASCPGSSVARPAVHLEAPHDQLVRADSCRATRRFRSARSAARARAPACRRTASPSASPPRW